MQRQADDDPFDVVFLDQLAVVARIAIRPAPLVELEREGDRATGVADGRADPPGAEVKAEDASHRRRHLRNENTPHLLQAASETRSISILSRFFSNFLAGLVQNRCGEDIIAFNDGSGSERASTMATATQSPIDPGQWEGRLVLHDVGWNDYEAMLEIVGERHIRVTYDRGTMEVVMPSQRHERATQLFGLFVPRLAEELEIRYEPLGMTTWRKPDAERGTGSRSMLLHPEPGRRS